MKKMVDNHANIVDWATKQPQQRIIGFVHFSVAGIDLTANHTAETSVTPVSQSAHPLPLLTGMRVGI